MLNASSNPDSPAIEPENWLDQHRWHAWMSVLYVIVLFFVAQVIAGTFIGAYASIVRHMSVEQVTQWLDSSVQGQFSYILVAEALSIGGIILFVRSLHIGLSTIGLRRPYWTDLVYGLAGVIPYYVLYTAVLAVAVHFVHGLDVNQKQEIGFDHVSGAGQMTLTFISLVILPPLAEEIMVRGLLYSSLKRAAKPFFAVVLTSALFASAHLPEGGSAGLLYIAALDTFVLSLVLIYLREKTQGLWAGMLLHALKNAVAFTALFALHQR